MFSDDDNCGGGMERIIMRTMVMAGCCGVMMMDMKCEKDGDDDVCDRCNEICGGIPKILVQYLF